ncbi:MAG: hypothetical protein IJ841_09710 [Prevotella sp.]|nr:hypothetical protein [Prevotella sp.]
MLSRLQLFRIIRRNNKLGYRRSPAFEQSMVAKVLMVLGAVFFVFYLIGYGVMFASIATGEDEPTMIYGLMPLMLVIDFGLRFMVQQTPAMLMKPYMLLPLPRNSVIDHFLVSSVISTYNWLWLAFFLPYIVIVLAGGCGWWLALSLLVCGMLLIMINSQFYLMVRTLVARNVLWWALPIVVYGGYWALLLVDKKGKAFEAAADGLTDFGVTPWLPLVCVGLMAILFWANRKMQFAFVYEEISKQEKKEANLKSVWQFRFLERFGEVGEYLKLELKSILRNKAIRSRVIMSLSLIVVLSSLIAYTPIYDGAMMLSFWCYYCFGLYGMTTLVKVMGPEGNYIDLLMVHRENILSLLRAKYYFHCVILVVPFLVMLPAVAEGKFSMLMMVAYMLLCSGLLYFLLFQLAVYNKQTLPLNQKITGKNNVENGLQLALELVGMLAPIALVAILMLIFGETVAYVIVACVGLVFTLLHPLWLRNVYQRMMARKYENLEGFHSTRE